MKRKKIQFSKYEYNEGIKYLKTFNYILKNIQNNIDISEKNYKQKRL